jgi:hypothetical protein
MYKNKYIILLLFFIILFCLNTSINYYKKHVIIKKIIEEWVNKTGGGYIKLDDDGNYEGDYYLSLSNFENRDSHIHLITNCIPGNLCYLPKKYDNHSKLHIINVNRNPNDIVDEMIKNLYYYKD